MLGMVFAAGLGTRLAPLTQRLPKPVVPLMNRPLARYSLEALAAAGVERCALNTHHLADAVPEALEGHVPTGMTARFVHEPKLLGTGGGLRHALTALIDEFGADDDTPILVMNGDILFWPELERALAVHRRLGAVATVVLRDHPQARRLGALELDAGGRVRRLLGEPEDVDVPTTVHMFTGVHVLSRRALRDLPAEGCIIRTAYRRWLDTDETVAGIVSDTPWRDLGTPREYLRAQLDLLSGRERWPGLECPCDGVLRGADVRVGEGAALREVVLGDGAIVEAGVRLERVMVWPGTRVSGDAHDAILAPHATVSVEA